MTVAQRQAFLAQCASASACGCGYAFDSFSLVDRLDNEALREHLLYRLVGVFH